MSRPESDIDLFATESLLDPYDNYKTLRNQSGAVWLNKYDMFFLSRYADVRDALGDAKVFSSAHGVTMNAKMNEALQGGLLCSDSPTHDTLRKIIEKPVTPRALADLRERISQEAESHVDGLVAKGSFDAATELAHHLPLTIVSELVGLPEEGRQRMLDWAPANFDCFGPINDRTEAAFPVVGEMIEYAFTQCIPGKLKPGGWAQMIWDAADRGEIDPKICPNLMNDYMGPSLDTTIFATASAIHLFATNPGQWEMLRKSPAMVPQAINEIIRLESPIQAFSRYVTQDHVIDSVTLPAGSRAIVSYGSANRDERMWGDPEEFRIDRKDTQHHLGFGFGEHVCVGNNLARLEIRALLLALLKRVKHFELGKTERAVNNVLRGYSKVEVTVH